MKKPIIYLFASAFLITGCKKEEEKKEEACTTCQSDTYLFASNEGKYPESGSITKINLSKSTIESDFYSTNNEGAELGQTVQSVFIDGNSGYAMVSGADQVVAFNANTGEHKAAIEINYPRNMTVINGFGYVSSGKYQGKISKIDLNSNTVLDTVAVGNGPEKMVETNNKLIVGNTGGWSSDSTVTVIDLTTFNVDTTIHLGPMIKGVEVDANGKVWALSSVVYEGPNDAKLFKLNPSNWTIEAEITISNNEAVNNLALSFDNENLFYFNSEGTFKLNIGDVSAPSFPIVNSASWYGIATHPSEQKFYLFNNGGFVANGFVNEYAFSGDSLKTFTTGISSNGGFVVE